jgi:hypothetical protein
LFLVATDALYSLLQNMGALQALSHIIEGKFVPTRQVRLVGAATAFACDLVEVLPVVPVVIVIVHQAQRLKLLIDLIHVFLELMGVAAIGGGTRICREL